MSIIRIKRSGSGGSPGALAQGEMGYSFLGGTQSNGGDRLYIGTGTETAGVAANIAVIGGKYFTDKLSQTPGTLTANAAIITDANNKIDLLNVDNITINDNTISSTNLNGTIILDPNGTGSVDVSSAKITSLATPTASSDAATKGYVDTAVSSFSSALNIAGDSGIDTVNLTSDTLTFTGGVGLTSVVSNNNITVNLDNTAVSPATYGSATATTTFTVDQQGRITSAAANTISIPSTQINDFAEAVQDTVGGMLTGTQNGISVTYTDNGVGGGYLNFDVADPTITLSGDVAGSATMTNLGNVTISTTIQPNSVALGTDTTGNYVASLVAGTGVTLSNNTGEGATPTVAIGQDVSPTSNVQFNYGTFNGNLTIDGNFIVGGTTTTISAQNLSISDNLVYLNQAAQETITNAVGDGVNVIYTTTSMNNFAVGFNVVITGMNPSSFNTTGATIAAANSTTFTIASTVTDTFIAGGLAKGQAGINPDLGLVAAYNDGTYAHTGFFRDATDGIFKAFKGYTPEPDASIYIDTAHASFALADIQANNFVGTLQGIANTALALNTARTIALAGDVVGSVSFNGTSNVSITTTIQPNSVALGTDTTGNYAADVSVTGNGLSITGAAGEGTSYTIDSNGTSLSTASTLVYRDSTKNFSANTITASLAGNASTATALQTARTIALSGDVVGSVSFDGTSNVSITTTIQADSVALGTDTTGNYVSAVSVTAGTGLSVTGTGEGASVTLVGINANNTVKGVASFDSNNFIATSGAISISSIDGGIY